MQIFWKGKQNLEDGFREYLIALFRMSIRCRLTVTSKSLFKFCE